MHRAIQIVGTVTIETSGIGSIQPVKSSTPFKNLTVIVKPIEDGTLYTAEIFFFGQLEETHTYSNANDAPIMFATFPDTMFPANVGTNSIPMHFDPKRADFGGIPILVRITNNSGERRTFEVYGVFEAFDHFAFGTTEPL